VTVAQLRLVGKPGEVQALLEVISAHTRVTDVYGPTSSRHTQGDVLLRAHIEEAYEPADDEPAPKAAPAARSARR
jgi:hypothetical protein